MPTIELKPHQEMDKALHSNTVYEQIVSSCAGAIFTSFFVTPFDVVKTRLQVQERGETHAHGMGSLFKSCVQNSYCLQQKGKFCCEMFRGTFDAFVKIPKREGLASLWSGLVPTLIISVPANVMYFTMYDQFRQQLSSNKLALISNAHLDPMIAGVSARVLTGTAVCPIEFLRTKLQSENVKYPDAFKNLRELVKCRGFFSLWHGWVPTTLRDAAFSALYWTIFDELKRLKNERKISENFIYGAFAGTVASVLTLPFDVVKTLRQSELGDEKLISGPKQAGTLSLLKMLYQRRGLKSLFAGIVPRILKVAPACAIMISSYEFGKLYYIQKKIKSLEQDEEQLK